LWRWPTTTTTNGDNDDVVDNNINSSNGDIHDDGIDFNLGGGKTNKVWKNHFRPNDEGRKRKHKRKKKDNC